VIAAACQERLALPRIYNQTSFAVRDLALIDRTGRNVVALVVKGTYDVDERGNLAVAGEQDPVRLADEWLGEPGKSDLRVPSDLLDFKPSAEVLVIRPREPLDQTPLAGRKVAVEVGPVRFSARVQGRWPFGPLRPDEKPRARYAGTYDKTWAENRMPLLPADFDARYHQSAPPGQTATGHLAGDEPFKLSGLYGENDVRAGRLPGRAVIVAGNVRSNYFTQVAVLDTVFVWADQPRLTLVWRSVVKPQQKIAEVRNLFVYSARIQAARELYGAP
jgi:hypothetical protein